MILGRRTSFDLTNVAVYKDDGEATLQDFTEEHDRFIVLPNNFPAFTSKCAR